MSLFSENVIDFSDLFGKRPRMRGVTGILDQNGQVNANPALGLEAGYVWVRLKGERAAIAVINVNVTTQRANVPVIVEEMDSGAYQVLSIDPEDAVFSYGVFAPALNMPDRIPEQDKSSIAHKRIKDLRLRLDTSGGLVLYVEAGIYQKLNGDIAAWLGGTIDLTASVPATVDTKRVVLIGITTSTNALAQAAQTAVVNSDTPTTSPYFTTTTIATNRNAALATVLWLWAVPLFYGQTTFGNTDDFVDLRPIQYEEGGVYQVTASTPLASSSGNAPNISLTGTVPVANGGTGQVTILAAFNALSPLTTKGDLLSNDATNDIRLAVGTANGMGLRVNSAAASGLEWSAVGGTFEATVSTVDATVTTLASYAMTTNTAVTIQARIIGTKTDFSAALTARLTAGYVRAAGTPVLIGVEDWYIQENSASAPTAAVDIDAGTNSVRFRVTGVVAEGWSWKVQYSVAGV